MKKKQVVVIHGGDVNDTYTEYLKNLRRWELDIDDISSNPTMKGWKEKLQGRLGAGYQVFTPDMPNWMNAKYVEWEIWFEKLMPFLHEGPVFIGHSLGGIFLARWFAEHVDSKKARAVFLLAAPYRDPSSKGQLVDFVLPKDLHRLKKLGSRLHLYHSTDDTMVPFSNFRMYAKALPEAQTRIFKDRDHFRQKEFLEIVGDIRAAFRGKI